MENKRGDSKEVMRAAKWVCMRCGYDKEMIWEIEVTNTKLVKIPATEGLDIREHIDLQAMLEKGELEIVHEFDRNDTVKVASLGPIQCGQCECEDIERRY